MTIFNRKKSSNWIILIRWIATKTSIKNIVNIRVCLSFDLHNLITSSPIFCHIADRCRYVVNCLQANLWLFVVFIANNFIITLLSNTASANCSSTLFLCQVEKKTIKKIRQITWTNNTYHLHVQRQDIWPFRLEMVVSVFSIHSIPSQLQTCQPKENMTFIWVLLEINWIFGLNTSSDLFLCHTMSNTFCLLQFSIYFGHSHQLHTPNWYHLWIWNIHTLNFHSILYLRSKIYGFRWLNNDIPVKKQRRVHWSIVEINNAKLKLKNLEIYIWF